MYCMLKIKRSTKDKFKMENEINYSNNIVIDLNGQKMCIEGITRYTTCDDVIEMVFYKSKLEAESFAVFESSFGIERMLYGKESILKVVRSWGADKNSYTLLIRKVDNIKSNMATISQAKRKLRKMRSQNVNKVTSVNNTIQANLNQSCRKQTVEKVIANSTPATDQDKYTKLGLLKRFLSDVMLQKKRQTKERSRSQMTLRTPGDGCNETLGSQNYRSYVENNNCNNTLNDNKYITHHHSHLNAAFVDSDNKSESDTANDDTTGNDTMDFDNTSIHVPIDTVVDVDESVISDSESAFEEDSICVLERNISESSDSVSEISSYLDSTDNEGSSFDAVNTVIKCNRIIDIFRSSCEKFADYELETDDDYMESFMNTIEYNSDSDEGMCSLESDSE